MKRFHPKITDWAGTVWGPSLRLRAFLWPPAIVQPTKLTVRTPQTSSTHPSSSIAWIFIFEATVTAKSISNQTLFAFDVSLRGTKPAPQSNVHKELRPNRRYYLQFRCNDVRTMFKMIADFLDDLDDAGYGDKCQTQAARLLFALDFFESIYFCFQ